MPHTRTVRDIGTLYAVPIHIQGMSAVRILQFRKLPHFQARSAKNTFNMSATLSEEHYKIKKNFPNEQHSSGDIVRIEYINSPPAIEQEANL